MLQMILLALVIFYLCYPILEDLYLLYIRGFPPGPISVPGIGNLYQHGYKTPYKNIVKLSQKYGDILSLRLGFTNRCVFVVDLESIKMMLNDQNSADRPDLPFFNFISKDAHGIGSRPYDHTWSLHTRLLHSAITKISKLNLDQYTSHALQLLFTRFDTKVDEVFDPTEDIQTATLNLLASITYGFEHKTLDDHDMKQLTWIYNTFNAGLNPLHVLNLFPILQYLPQPFFKEIRAAIKKRDEMMDRILLDHVQNYSGETHDLIDILAGIITGDKSAVRLTESERQNLHIPSFQMSIFSIIMAGQLNLTNIYLWIMLYLAKYPDDQAKVHDEIRENSSETVTLGQEQDMPYTAAFVLELLRIVTPNHFGVPRQTSRDITIGGYNIPKGTKMDWSITIEKSIPFLCCCHAVINPFNPKYHNGTTVFANLWNVHHHDKHWENPDEFKPTRFLEIVKQNPSFKDLRSYPFIPFGWGKRQCIGMKPSMDIMFLFLSNLVQKYHIKLSEDSDPDMAGKTELTVTPFPFKIVLRKRH